MVGCFSEMAGSLLKGAEGTGFRCLRIHSHKRLPDTGPCTGFRDGDPVGTVRKTLMQHAFQEGRFSRLQMSGLSVSRTIFRARRDPRLAALIPASMSALHSWPLSEPCGHDVRF